MIAWFTRQSVQSRLLVIFSSLILLGAIGIGMGVLAVTRLSAFVGQGLASAESAQRYADLDSLLQEQELTLYQYAQSNDPLYLRQYSNLEKALDYQFRLVMSSNDLNAGTLNPLRQIATDLETLNRQADPLLARIEENKPTMAAAVGGQALAQSREFTDLRRRLQGVADQQQAAMIASVTEIRGIATLLVLGGAGILAGFVIFVVLVALVVDDIADPILTLAASVTAYQNGSFQPAMIQRYLPRNDELGLLARSLDQLIRSVQQQKRTQDQLLASMSRFFPSAYLDLLQKSSIEEIQLGDHISAEMAVLFSDIRSFTAISEKMTPSQNFSLINNYLKRVSPIVQQHNGFIVKFLGDGVMAVFPYRVEDALQAAIAKLQTVAAQSHEMQSQHGPAIEIGIGIHTGHMMVGMIGDEQRMQGDAFSDNVNLTARIESLTRFFQVSLIISAETLARLESPGKYMIRPLGLVQVKGRVRPISLYEVFDADPLEVRQAKQATLIDYEAGLKAYRLGQFEQAITNFEQVLQRNPQDHPAALFLERARQYLAQGAPPAWEGVEIMDSK